jgi:hypothetical protein
MEKIVNKKIKGAVATEFDGIKFRSRLECSCYKKLKDSGLKFYHEPERIALWKGIKLENTQVMAPKKIKVGKFEKTLSPQVRALRDITYTPDFLVEKGNHRIYFDAKGKENDTYPLKKKMFLKMLESRDDGFIYSFYEPHSVKQMVESIELIQKL